jgi:sulfite exporter TauE/SafE
MGKNVGTVDRVLRIVAGLVLIAYALGFIAPDTGYNVWGWIGVVPLATAFIGFCPAYRLIGVSTCKTGT